MIRDRKMHVLDFRKLLHDATIYKEDDPNLDELQQQMASLGKNPREHQSYLDTLRTADIFLLLGKTYEAENILKHFGFRDPYKLGWKLDRDEERAQREASHRLNIPVRRDTNVPGEERLEMKKDESEEKQEKYEEDEPMENDELPEEDYEEETTEHDYSPKAEGEDAVPGGVGADVPFDELDPEQLQIGMNVEQKHSDDPAIQADLARDNLVDNPDYYKMLMDMLANKDLTEQQPSEPEDTEAESETMEQDNNDWAHFTYDGNIVSASVEMARQTKLTEFTPKAKSARERTQAKAKAHAKTALTGAVAMFKDIWNTYSEGRYDPSFRINNRNISSDLSSIHNLFSRAYKGAQSVLSKEELGQFADAFTKGMQEIYNKTLDKNHQLIVSTQNPLVTKMSTKKLSGPWATFKKRLETFGEPFAIAKDIKGMLKSKLEDIELHDDADAIPQKGSGAITPIDDVKFTNRLNDLKMTLPQNSTLTDQLDRVIKGLPKAKTYFGHKVAVRTLNRLIDNFIQGGKPGRLLPDEFVADYYPLDDKDQPILLGPLKNVRFKVVFRDLTGNNKIQPIKDDIVRELKNYPGAKINVDKLASEPIQYQDDQWIPFTEKDDPARPDEYNEQMKVFDLSRKEITNIRDHKWIAPSTSEFDPFDFMQQHGAPPPEMDIPEGSWLESAVKSQQPLQTAPSAAAPAPTKRPPKRRTKGAVHELFELDDGFAEAHK